MSAALYALLGYSLERSQFTGLLGLYFLAFWGYSIRVRALNHTDGVDTFYQLAGIVFRVILLLAPPNLSDDYARFVWDGRLLINGFSPYLYLPRDLLSTDIAQIANLNPDLFHRLNSPDYYTVYPPLNQAFFGLAAWLGGDSLASSVIWLRVPILLADIGTVLLLPHLLRRLGYRPNYALIYSLNPLVILELTGNIHFEGVVIFLCLGAVWVLVPKEMTSLCLDSTKRKLSAEMSSLQFDFPIQRHFAEMTSLQLPHLLRSALLFSLAVSTKLLPLIGLPLLIRYLGWKQGLVYSILVGLLTTATFIPFASLELIQNIAASVNLYFQKFEFNASIYYLVRWAGYWIRGYNVIQQVGPWLSLITALGILWLAFGRRQLTFGTRLLLSLTLYFAMATTVHPWYITLLIAASVFAPFRYPLVWSAFCWVSYATYQREPYLENLWLTALEYGLVLAVGVWEWWRIRHITGINLQ